MVATVGMENTGKKIDAALQLELRTCPKCGGKMVAYNTRRFVEFENVLQRRRCNRGCGHEDKAWIRPIWIVSVDSVRKRTKRSPL